MPDGIVNELIGEILKVDRENNKDIDCNGVIHSIVGDFTYENCKDKINQMTGGGHSQANIEFLQKNGIAVTVINKFKNGVRVGNVSIHRDEDKVTNYGQSWFPANWKYDDIIKAGKYVISINRANVKEGAYLYGKYNGVRVLVIISKGKIGTIAPDKNAQP